MIAATTIRVKQIVLTVRRVRPLKRKYAACKLARTKICCTHPQENNVNCPTNGHLVYPGGLYFEDCSRVTVHCRGKIGNRTFEFGCLPHLTSPARNEASSGSTASWR